MSVYLDYNATTPIDPRVLDVMIDVYRNHPGNADSRTHDYGNTARIITENARAKVAGLLGVSSDEIVFTSGATESNNIAIQGLRAYGERTGKKHIITTSIEHKAVLNTVKHMGEIGFDVEFINPGVDGRVSQKDIISHVRKDTLLVSVMHVNNETGIIQPVKEIGDELSKQGILFHVDATQSCGKLVDDIRNIKYDMLSFSGHKFRGPQGIGVLVLRKNDHIRPPVTPVMYGGQQENGLRPGTTPVALVAGLGKACEIAAEEYEENEVHNIEIKKDVIALLDKSGIDYEFNGEEQYCTNNTVNVFFKGISSEALMLSTKEYCSISNGSACTSKSYDPSYVLTAMGLPVERIQNSVRISWGSGTSTKELLSEFSKFLTVAKSLA